MFVCFSFDYLFNQPDGLAFFLWSETFPALMLIAMEARLISFDDHKHNYHHQITFSICSSGCYNSSPAAKQNLKLMI